VREIKDLLFPERCIVCGVISNSICEACSFQIKPFRGADVPNIDQCWSASAYDGSIRTTVISYKSGRREFAGGIAKALIKTVDFMKSSNPKGCNQFDAIVAIPTTQRKISERGFDTVGEIALEVSKISSVPYLRALTLIRPVNDQVGLNPQERKVNVSGAFKAIQPSPAKVLLLDDVITTGSTIATAARALRVAGAQKIFAVSACRTMGRRTV
jgi:ComF family protein